jgi:SAM-dependent methyltransferase
MSIERKLPKVLPWCLQECPLCHEQKYVVARGIIKMGDSIARFPDRGYSFCNCKNIWFTDWENIDLRGRHENESVEVLRSYVSDVNINHLNYINSGFYRICSHIQNKGYMRNKTLLIGDTPKTKEEFSRLGFVTSSSIEGKSYDLIWAYHILEHCHYPLETLQEWYNALDKDGELFIAMPDPYFIEFNDTAAWGHWLLREHYIMWDMDSFCDEAKRIGFKVVYKTRNTFVKVCKDMHIILQK